MRTRLILCIDGTWCREDGVAAGRNQTNVYRIWASIKAGPCRDETTGIEYHQRPIYIRGIGTAEVAADELPLLDQLVAGASGKGYSEQIRQAYEKCCELTKDDEVWLYGFSRGAFVVRAIAGLLLHVRSIIARGDDFKKDYKKALKIYQDIRHLYQKTGETYRFVREKTKPAPVIKFVGAFDTVKALRDRNLHDISFNCGILHMRQALALHEDRQAMEPESIYPNFGDPAMPLQGRSFVQAWFVGAHMDIGGSAKEDGLSLYPLQWMLDESKQSGLVLEFERIEKQPIDNPLSLVFPDSLHPEQIHTFTAANGIRVRMHDIRDVLKINPRYKIKLNVHRSKLWRRSARHVFAQDGSLSGYHVSVPQGTIIHPSVYLLLFHHSESIMPLTPQENELQKRLFAIERKMLGVLKGMVTDQGFWLSDQPPTGLASDVRWPVRILVCGNAGVGKSTLINKVFGVEDLAKPSARLSGKHDIEKEHTWPGRPDLIVHDSCGFEAASADEMTAVKTFLKDMSSRTEPKDRLHVIWFCLPTSSNRTMQKSTSSLFEAISQYAPNVPVVVVATQKDIYVDSEFGKKFRELSQTGVAYGAAECEAFAEQQLHERVQLMEREMRGMIGESGQEQLQLCVAVSQEDEQSIIELTNETVACIDDTEIRMACIGAQVTNIDAKINAAVKQVMRTYKSILGTATVCGMAPAGATTERSAAAIACVREILICFGLPSVDVQTAYQILRKTIWDDMGANTMIALSEGLTALGTVGTIVSCGLPFFLASTAATIPLIVPATARLYLMISCDLILILILCFQEAIYTKIGQPGKKELTKHAREYRWSSMSDVVHDRVKKLVPRRDFTRAYRTDRIRLELDSIISEHRHIILEQSRQAIEYPTAPAPPAYDKVQRKKVGSEPSEDDMYLTEDMIEAIAEKNAMDY